MKRFIHVMLITIGLTAIMQCWGVEIKDIAEIEAKFNQAVVKANKDELESMISRYAVLINSGGRLDRNGFLNSLKVGENDEEPAPVVIKEPTMALIGNNALLTYKSQKDNKPLTVASLWVNVGTNFVLGWRHESRPPLKVTPAIKDPFWVVNASTDMLGKSLLKLDKDIIANAVSKDIKKQNEIPVGFRFGSALGIMDKPAFIKYSIAKKSFVSEEMLMDYRIYENTVIVSYRLLEKDGERYMPATWVSAVFMRKNEKYEPVYRQESADETTQTQASYISTSTGLQYFDVVEGGGAQPKVGDKAKVHYTGWLLDGTKFDSSYDRSMPFDLVVGVGQVIKGWDEALLTMKVGTKRRLIIPADLAYGSSEAGRIPPNSTLLFEVELLGIEPGKNTNPK